VAAVGIYLGKDHDIQRLNDRAHLGRGEDLLAQPDALPVAVGAQENHAEIDQDVGSAPFASVHPGKKADRRTLAAVASAHAEGVAQTFFPGQMRERDALQDLGMVLLAQHDRRFDLVDGEVPAAPDHVAVASAFEASLRRGTAFGLACASISSRGSTP
jgi:hypothetical protein